ncbi:MAG: tyrosine-type recombinase/integrase [Acidobacteriota bacterium]|nr:tyrosine-type recombinase/integrase [Acidobacteriota bacterium]
MAGKGRVFKGEGRRTWSLAYMGPRPDGTWGEIRQSAGTEDEPEARRQLEQRVREARNHRDGIASFEDPGARKILCGALLDGLETYWEEKGIKGWDRARYRVAELRRFFGSRKAAGVDIRAIRKFIAKRRADGLSNSSINRETEILRKAFREAVRERRLPASMMPSFPQQLPGGPARSGFFDQSEIDALLPHLPFPLDEMTRFAFRTGWRRGELLGMTWQMVSRQEVVLPDTKNGERRTLPISDLEMAAIFARLRKAREVQGPGGPALAVHVFHRGGQPINKTVFGKQWRRACIAAGLGHLDEQGHYGGRIFHDLRRSAVRNMVRGGVPQSVARSISGHKTDSMFRRYDISDSRDKSLALELARKWSAAQEPEGSNVKEIGG